MQQGSAEWLANRAGKFTASRAADLMARTRNGPSTSRQNLLETLAYERISGLCADGYRNDAMQRGLELEAEARDALSFALGKPIIEVAWVPCADLPNTGCSPDGIIDAETLIEIKCPAQTRKHLGALLRNEHADEYRWQVQHQMLCTGAKRNIIASYDPRWPQPNDLAQCIVERDEAAIAELREAIIAADVDVEHIVSQLRGLHAAPKHAAKRKELA